MRWSHPCSTLSISLLKQNRTKIEHMIMSESYAAHGDMPIHMSYLHTVHVSTIHTKLSRYETKRGADKRKSEQRRMIQKIICTSAQKGRISTQMLAIVLTSHNICFTTLIISIYVTCIYIQILSKQGRSSTNGLLFIQRSAYITCYLASSRA